MSKSAKLKSQTEAVCLSGVVAIEPQAHRLNARTTARSEHFEHCMRYMMMMMMMMNITETTEEKISRQRFISLHIFLQCVGRICRIGRDTSWIFDH